MAEEEPELECDHELEALRRYRFERLRRLGFEDWRALMLEEAGVDLRYAERLVSELGCPLPQAFGILL